MSTADIIILILLGVGAVKGFSQGFVVEIFSFIGFFVGLLLALHLAVPVTNEFFSGSDYFSIISIIVFVALFILLSLSIRMGARLIKQMIDVTLLGTLDNLVGAITGIIKWAFLISIVFWVMESVGFEFQQKLVDESLIFPYIVDLGPIIFGWIGEIIPFIRDLIDSMEGIPQTKDPFLTIAC